ncbi:ribonuclease domain-containing protein [Streptomyces sp. SH5]|uniref:Ribonuclease domain-containing protein n=1 Tax=Streptomyces sindenensis TaxID=67363 RepID=A0ABW6EB51_9ACTN|nr:ribonuclease domain-containing protein [Streptomyces sp. SH5]WGP13470.1 ribonuclease domain-containing protein [Streptomyces sp. SH5]
MRIPPRITRLGGSAALLSLLLASGPVTAQAATPATTSTTAHSASAFRAAAVGSICFSALPSQAHDTLDLIEQGGPFPYEQDGTVFQNREGLLPGQSTGYYHEYTVITPGSPTRGARRIVTGERNEEDYYTADHYASFDLVDHDC